MLKSLRKALSIEDIRKRLLYTFAMLIVVRLGSQLPTPGVDPTFIQNFFAQQTGDAFNFFEAFTGGSFTRMSVFALSITPYITSSIIMQLLTIAIPKLEEMQKDGEDGRKKIAAITRYVTVGLALIESIAMAVGFGRQGLLEEYNFVNCAIVVCTLTAGSAFLMWIGERITEKGVGNGISIVLLINIVSRVPDDFVTLYTQFMKGKTIAKAGLAGVIILAVLLVVVVFVIILQDGERRIAVQYSKKVQGRKMVGGQSTHIPLKVNTAGVIPVIFSSSLTLRPGGSSTRCSGWASTCSSRRAVTRRKPVTRARSSVNRTIIQRFRRTFSTVSPRKSPASSTDYIIRIQRPGDSSTPKATSRSTARGIISPEKK